MHSEISATFLQGDPPGIEVKLGFEAPPGASTGNGPGTNICTLGQLTYSESPTPFDESDEAFGLGHGPILNCFARIV